MSKKLELKPGDRIQITLRGRNYTGTVKTAHNYADSQGDDWYIEMNDDQRGYAYWKQRQDGGAVSKL